jgi:hypothetical protein
MPTAPCIEKLFFFAKKVFERPVKGCLKVFKRPFKDLVKTSERHFKGLLKAFRRLKLGRSCIFQGRAKAFKGLLEIF